MQTRNFKLFKIIQGCGQSNLLWKTLAVLEFIFWVTFLLQCCLFAPFLYLLDAQPTPEEKAVWEVVNVVLENTSNILKELKEYKGASDEIRVVGRLIQKGTQALVKHLWWSFLDFWQSQVDASVTQVKCDSERDSIYNCLNWFFFIFDLIFSNFHLQIFVFYWSIHFFNFFVSSFQQLSIIFHSNLNFLPITLFSLLQVWKLFLSDIEVLPRHPFRTNKAAIYNNHLS